MTLWKRILSVISCTAFLKECKSNSYWILPRPQWGKGDLWPGCVRLLFSTSAHPPLCFLVFRKSPSAPRCHAALVLLHHFTDLISLKKTPAIHARRNYIIMSYYEHDSVLWIWTVIGFSRGASCNKSNIRSMSDRGDMEETALWNQTSSGLPPGLSSYVCTFYSFLYLFLLQSRLPQGSRHIGGASVSGRSNFVPWLGGSAYLEIAGHHPRQTGVC